MMTYKETVEYLFQSAPLFQHIGAGAYKEGLETTRALDEHFGNPHGRYATIHVAGTNGKGSCSHTLAAILQSAGYKVGLFTSPHLVDFRERIRVNGQMIPEEYVVNFVRDERNFFEPLHPSFFEITTAMAFKYFADEHVDIAIIEIGLGGRLDCTNIITPVLGIITNISFDHQQFLGNTLAAIAGEKAGIIKPGIPIVIGETTAETRPVFAHVAETVQAPIVWAEEECELIKSEPDADSGYNYQTASYGHIHGVLGGFCQERNTRTILAAVRLLREQGIRFTDDDVRNGFMGVCRLTGLRGRWEILHHAPYTVCDTGHNIGGLQYIVRQLQRIVQAHHEIAVTNGLAEPTLRIVFGMVNDKDVNGALSMLPRNAQYYFCNASVKRALPAEELAEKAREHGLHGVVCGSVAKAYHTAQQDTLPNDIIYIGGSSFVVADLLADFEADKTDTQA